MIIQLLSSTSTTYEVADNAIETSIDRGRALGERRRLGAFYTPQRLSNLLADWSIQSPGDKILEPSFGGCGFLTSAIEALERLGCREASSQIFGCDIDPAAFQSLKSVFGPRADLAGFLFKDFLDCNEEPQWPAKFDVVLANPPYIPHHRIGKDRVRELSSRKWPIAGMSGRCSLWGYFIVHAVKMLKTGGRMAWVLPGAFLQADYAKPIKDYLASMFDRVATLVVRDRLFLSEGTDEETVVLLADGFRKTPGEGVIELGAAETLDDLTSLISKWDDLAWVGDKSGSSPATLGMSSKADVYFREISTSATKTIFGSLARVQIGIVTGANDFFLHDSRSLAAADLEKVDCERVLSKFKASPGIVLNEHDLDRYDAIGGKTYLVNTCEPERDNRIGRYLATFDSERRKTISTFKKRAVWSATSDGRKPHGFFPVMHHTGPRLVLNNFGYTSTNTIHRVFFHKDDLHERRLAAVSLLTSFSQVSAELVGRRYGSGVLKHEPRDAERVALLMPRVTPTKLEAALRKIDLLLRQGDGQGASVAADHFIFGAANVEDIEAASVALQASLKVIRERRRPPRKSAVPAVSPHLS